MLLAFLLPMLLAAPVLVRGEAPLAGGRCGASREGLTACIAGRACLCRYERGGQMTGRPGGFRWDCGALRPDCTPAGPAVEALPLGPAPWTEPPPPR